MDRPVVVTGAGGFVGASLVRALAARGLEVHGLLRPGGDAARLAGVPGRVHLHRVDLLDAPNLSALVREACPGLMIHTATHGAYSWEQDADRILAVNVLGMEHVLSAAVAAGVEVLINTGSSSEYGLCDHAPDEDEPPRPNSTYAVAKASATMLCQHVAERESLYVPTLRLYSVYGPWEDPRRFVATLVRESLRGRLPPLADPLAARDFVFIDDVVAAYLAVAERRPAAARHGPVFNVGSGVQRTLAEVVEEARGLFRVAEEPRWNAYPDRTWDTHTWVSCPRRLEHEAGWRAATPLGAGLLATAAWLRSTDGASFDERRKHS